MSNKRRNQLMLRWSLVTAGAIALFWGVWYLVNGSVPVVTSIHLTDKQVLNLSFGVSRWWDVLIGPIYSMALISVFTNKKVLADKNLALGLVFGLTFGLVFGLVSGLAYGLAYGLVSGLAIGLIFGLAIGLASGLVFGLVVLVQFVFSSNTWKTVGNWLMAK